MLRISREEILKETHRGGGYPQLTMGQGYMAIMAAE
jgi:hypothetical protein